MTGIVAVIIKILPDSPDANLEEIKIATKDSLTQLGSQNISFKEEPIAFGLYAIKAKFAWPEEKDTDLIETQLKKIEHISSIQIEDYRRAFG
jgi:elongation factor 1-beta